MVDTDRIGSKRLHRLGIELALVCIEQGIRWSALICNAWYSQPGSHVGAIISTLEEKLLAISEELFTLDRDGGNGQDSARKTCCQCGSKKRGNHDDACDTRIGLRSGRVEQDPKSQLPAECGAKSKKQKRRAILKYSGN
jgi:hypothetical protein